MQVVDAYWEKRNLLVNTYEMKIDIDDDFNSFIDEEKKILQKNVQYLVVKCPVNMSEFLWGLPKQGYTFLETQFYLELTKKKYVYPEFLNRFEKDTIVTAVTDSKDIEEVLSHYYENIFDTDRISIDNHFSKELSARRYYNWTKDLIQNDSVLYKLSLKEKMIGLFITKKINDKTAYPVLGALLNEYKGKGLGYLLLKKHLDTIFEHGFEKTQTIVVSNNKDILKLSTLIGYEIADMAYVYVKHV